VFAGFDAGHRLPVIKTQTQERMSLFTTANTCLNMTVWGGRVH